MNKPNTAGPSCSACHCWLYTNKQLHIRFDKRPKCCTAWRAETRGQVHGLWWSYSIGLQSHCAPLTSSNTQAHLNRILLLTISSPPVWEQPQWKEQQKDQALLSFLPAPIFQALWGLASSLEQQPFLGLFGINYTIMFHIITRHPQMNSRHPFALSLFKQDADRGKNV